MASVVVIDDDPDIRMLVRMALEIEGHHVDDAANGLVGLDVVRAGVASGSPPVVVLDVQMPDIDGWEVLARIRDETALDAVGVIMCTVRAGALDRERGYGLGADAYEAKPFDLEHLLATVSRLSSLDLEELLTRREQTSEHIAGTDNQVT